MLVGDDSRPVLEQHWREVLLNQFHDIIPGSSIARVNREAIETYERIEARARRLRRRPRRAAPEAAATPPRSTSRAFRATST